MQKHVRSTGQISIECSYTGEAEMVLRLLMSKDSSIARHYRRLRGETQEDEEGDFNEEFD